MYAMSSQFELHLKGRDVKHIYTHSNVSPDTLLLNLLGGGAVERKKEKEKLT